MANKALLVGINKYPGAALAGCVNDIIDVAQKLVQQFGFKSEEIRLLVDERATTAGILERLNWLVQSILGDRVLFYYSGHGAQYPARNDQSEIDGNLEVICPADFDWSPVHMITDKQFVQIFSKMPSGVLFNWVSDSCHSGDLDKNIPGGPGKINAPKRFPIPVDIAWRQRIAREKNIKANRGLINGQLEVGYISGCQSDQTSADAYFDKPNGALSYYFLRNLQPGIPIATITQQVINDLHSHNYSQTPTVDGTRANQPFLA
jgi:uncharacterized caspase-like protein